MGNKNSFMSENDVISFVSETNNLIKERTVQNIGDAVVSAHYSNALTDNVEFWRWMKRNYKNSGIFDSADTMKKYILGGEGKEKWMRLQLQGKGYEWDCMRAMRGKIENIPNTYSAGDSPNRPGTDVTRRNLITGQEKEYQMKAYLSKTNPDLKNTPKDVTVVTNKEKVDVVKKNGYDTESFLDKKAIKKNTDKRMQQIKDGKAYTSYNLENVSMTMLQSGAVGAVVGMGVESFGLYKSFKQGKISKDKYLEEVLKAGGESGITAGVSAGIMIPISATITVAGASTLITIPIAYFVNKSVNDFVAPCFGRGKYKAILNEARYYTNLEHIYRDMLDSIVESSNSFYEEFVSHMRIIDMACENEFIKGKEIDKQLKQQLRSIE